MNLNCNGEKGYNSILMNVVFQNLEKTEDFVVDIIEVACQLPTLSMISASHKCGKCFEELLMVLLIL